MDEKDWLILQTIYRERNITKASEHLYISQPSLTYRIQQMEKEFGTKILSRRKRGVDFTTEGEYLVRYAEQMLKQLQETKDYLNNIGGEIKGTLRLAVSRTYGRYRLPNILAEFLRHFPGVEIQLKTGFSFEIFQMINQEEAAVGIVRDLYHWKGTKVLIDEEEIYVVSKNPLSLNNLPYLPRIDYTTDHSLKNTIDTWWNEKFELPPTITMEVDTIDTCREMVLHGLGYAILPGICLMGHDDLFKQELLFNSKKIVRNTWLVFQKSSLELGVNKAFIEFLEHGTRRK